MSRKYFNKRNAILGVAAIVIVAGGVYFAGKSNAAPTAAAPAAQAIPVVVQKLTEQKVRAWTEFSGRLHAVDSAEIRPEVSGRITKISFQDGQQVKAGQVLLVIDPRPYEAAVSKAQADLATAKTNADFAKVELDRANAMIETKAIAQRLYDERANANRVAQANVQAADAELKTAEVNLDHAYVKAPISGRISRAEITVGNLVQTTPSAPLLTSIVSNNNIYADFEVDEQTYLKSIRNYANGRDKEVQIPVQLAAQGDKDHVYKGYIYSFDNKIDPASGTIRARAKFENSDGALVPGMFVSVSLANGVESTELLVPERAIGFDQSKKFVFTVGADNKVAYREVELGKEIDSQRVVLKGLNAGDRVIVDGVQHVKPDAVVDATDYVPEAAASPGAGDKAADAPQKPTTTKQ